MDILKIISFNVALYLPVMNGLLRYRNFYSFKDIVYFGNKCSMRGNSLGAGHEHAPSPPLAALFAVAHLFSDKVQ